MCRLSLTAIVSVALVLDIVAASEYPELLEDPTNEPVEYTEIITGKEFADALLKPTESALELQETRISSSVLLADSSLIRRPVKLVRCRFESKVSARGCRFEGGLDLWACYFSDSTEIEESTFLEYVSFYGCTFSMNASFENDSLCSDLDFTVCTFDSAAQFSGNTYLANATFRQCEFLAYSDFSQADFLANAFFTNSVFSGTVRFEFNEFSRDVIFDGAGFMCAIPAPIEPLPGYVYFSETHWGGTLSLSPSVARAGVVIDFTGARWDSVPKASDGNQLPVLFLEDANYDRLVFPVSDEGIPKPLFAFDVDATYPVVQRTYGKYLNQLTDEGRFHDYDMLLKEFHNWEANYFWELGGLKGYLRWFMLRSMKLFCGYGIDPLEAFWVSLWTVLGFSGIYRFPSAYRNIHPRYQQDRSAGLLPPAPVAFEYRGKRLGGKIWEAITKFVVLFGRQLKFFMNFVLFSVNTFCTVGYDNNYPVGWLRYVCMIELILGYVTLTLFLVSMVNVLMR